MAAAGVWEPAELLAAAGGAPPGLSVLPTLLGAPDSAALAELASAVLEANAEDTAAACAAVRLFEPRIWVQKGHIETYLATYSPHVDAALQVLGPDRLHPDFMVRLLTLAVVATIAGQPYPAGCAALAADPALAAHAVAQVVALVDDHVIIPAVGAGRQSRADRCRGGIGGVRRRCRRPVGASRPTDRRHPRLHRPGN